MMKRTKSFRVKAVVVGAALTLLLGAGAASASHGADDGVGHVRNSSDDKAKASGRVRNSDDGVGHVRHSGVHAAGHR